MGNTTERLLQQMFVGRVRHLGPDMASDNLCRNLKVNLKAQMNTFFCALEEKEIQEGNPEISFPPNLNLFITQPPHHTLLPNNSNKKQCNL